MRSGASHSSGRQSGFTLVELLIVITIIGILVGLLLPAVNSAREAGRNAQCKNNLKQLGIACLAHEEAQGIFPTGGWGWFWVGDPDRGNGEQQPGGWIYNILPHTEMNNVHDLGRYGNASTKQQAILQMVSTPWPLVGCPTRRRPSLWPKSWNGGNDPVAYNAGGVTAGASFKLARTDYAVNVGSAALDEYGPGPGIGGDSTMTYNSTQSGYFGSRITGMGAFQQCTGVCFERSTIRKDDVSDGLSQTVLAGEKYLGLDNYGTGQVGADNENMYVGMDNDIGRTTSAAPMQDRWGSNDTMRFGSAHAGACNFVMCDGSTFTVNYTVDPTIFLGLGTRAGGESVDLTKL